MKWRVFSHDIIQAYLQSKDSLRHLVYICAEEKDRAQLTVDSENIWSLSNRFRDFTTPEITDYWSTAIENHPLGDWKSKWQSMIFYYTFSSMMENWWKLRESRWRTAWTLETKNSRVRKHRNSRPLNLGHERITIFIFLELKYFWKCFQERVF